MESVSKVQKLTTAIVVFGATVLLVWFGNGLTPWWPLMWFAPLPVLWFALRRSWWRAGLMTASAWLVGSLNLLGYFHLQGTPFLGWLADFGGMALIVAMGVLLFRALVLRGAIWSGIVALPALWVSMDWLRNWATPHATSADLAYTQLKFLPFLQLASVTGPWGMSFVLVLLPAATAVILYLHEREPQRAIRVLFVVGGLMLLVLGFGRVRLSMSGQHETVKAGLVASDATNNDGIADSGPEAAHLFGEYAAQSKMLADRGAQLVVLPEKIAIVHDRDEVADHAIFQQVADAAGVTIVAGELHISPKASSVLKYNRAEVYAPHMAAVGYDKEHMLPPFESNLTRGTAKLAMPRGNTSWGVAICKDMDFTSIGRAYGQLDTGLMLVPAWDFNLDRTWHGHMAIMRGVEEGFSVVRAAKNGYLFASDDRGRVIAEARTDSAPFATLLAEVPVGHERTLFQMWGDWFAWVAVGILGFVSLRMVGLLLERK